MNEVSNFRILVLKIMYLFITIGLVLTIWPQILNHPTPWSLWHGVGCSMLGALSLLSFVGCFRPLLMLPILFFEILWKLVWLIFVAFPLWSSGLMDSVNAETVNNCFVGIIIPFSIPWKYVFNNLLRQKA